MDQIRMSITTSQFLSAQKRGEVIADLITNAAEQFGFVNQVQFNNVSPLPYSLNAQHTLLRGDNLDALLRLYYAGTTVKAIYIDPPYNTGKTFIYNDRFSGLDGIFKHQTAWMSFMLPRLLLAYELLEPAGVMFVSIDDNVQAYLKVLLDWVFNPSNFIAQFVVVRSKNGRGSSKNVALSHEYAIAYGKSSTVTFRGRMEQKDAATKYTQEDEHGRYYCPGLFRKKGEDSRREDRPNMYYPLYYTSDGKVYLEPGEGRQEVYPKDSNGVERRWLWGRETANVNSHKLFAGKSGTIYVKKYYDEGERSKVRTFLNSPVYYTETATNELKKIYKDKIFETPKPIRLIQDLLDLVQMKDSDIVLDFFAGTGTTAEAVSALNQNDNVHRRTILVESNVLIPPSHIAYKYGYRVISDLTYERLKYVGNKYQTSFTSIESDIHLTQD
jgi:adenine-specific DNA-methyltransferase